MLSNTARDEGQGTRDKEYNALCHPERSEGTHLSAAPVILSEAKELT